MMGPLSLPHSAVRQCQVRPAREEVRSYCCPDAKHCLTPIDPPKACGATAPCATGQTKMCVSVGPACVPPTVCPATSYCQALPHAGQGRNVLRPVQEDRLRHRRGLLPGTFRVAARRITRNSQSATQALCGRPEQMAGDSHREAGDSQRTMGLSSATRYGYLASGRGDGHTLRVRVHAAVPTSIPVSHPPACKHFTRKILPLGSS